MAAMTSIGRENAEHKWEVLMNKEKETLIHSWTEIICYKCNKYGHIEKYCKNDDGDTHIYDKRWDTKDNHKRKTIKVWRRKITIGEEETNARKEKAWKF